MRIKVAPAARVALPGIATHAALEQSGHNLTVTVAKEYLLRTPIVGEVIRAGDLDMVVDRAGLSGVKGFTRIEGRLQNG